MDPAQLSIAYVAGALSFLSPCALPMLPAYISFYIERGESRGGFLTGIKFSASIVAGFLLVYVSVGIAASFVISEVVRLIQFSIPLIGSTLIVLGFLTWMNMIRVPGFSFPMGAKSLSFLLYGSAYAIASLGCSLPIFLLVVLQGAIGGGFFSILTQFVAYIAGAATFIVPLTMTLSMAKGVVYKRLLTILPKMRMMNGFILILAGFYMIFTFLTL